jgi:hypothetical protein
MQGDIYIEKYIGPFFFSKKKNKKIWPCPYYNRMDSIFFKKISPVIFLIVQVFYEKV